MSTFLFLRTRKKRKNDLLIKCQLKEQRLTAKFVTRVEA